MANENLPGAAVPLSFESLEERRLMSGEPWQAFARLIGMDQLVANHPSINGAGGSIAILDTGVDYRHPQLGGGIGQGYKVVAGWDFVGNDADPMDTDGHGTGVAGAAAASPFVVNGYKYQGVAPGANLIALRVDDGTFTWKQEAPYVEQALQWVIANRVKYNIIAVNMSLGKGHYTDELSTTIISDELATLGQLGMFMVSSSGNDGVMDPLGIEYPGADPNVYSVGSVNSADVISTFTERGPNMDLLAPGEQVPLIYYMPDVQRHIALLGDGTSFAAPAVAGLGALLKQIDPSLTPQEMMAIIKSTGVPNYDGDKEAAPYTGLTWPRIKLDAAVEAAYAGADDTLENNDTLASASALSFNGNTASAGNLSLVIGDADFYKFTLADHADVSLSLSVSNGASTPAWALLDSQGTLIKNLSASDAIRLAGGTYYLRLSAPAATLNGTYGITIQRTPDDALNNHTTATATPIALSDGEGAISGAVLLGNLDDYYSFTLDAVSDVSLAVNYGGTTMPAASLLDTSGNLIAGFSAGSLERRLSAGRYLVRLHSDANLAGTYGLGIVAIPFVVPGQDGTTNVIAYDAQGTLHLAYYDSTTENLKYATRDAQGNWTNASQIDASRLVGQYLSMDLDSQGRPAVAYYDAWNGDLKFAHLEGGAWRIEVVDSTFTTGYYPSLKFDSIDRPVITYFYKTGGDLRFALGAPISQDPAWSIATIDSAGDVGRHSSLALNPATGRWAAGYEDTSRGIFKYAEQGRSAWTATVVDGSTKSGGGYISLAFSPKTGLPSMSYYDAWNADLKLASFNGSRWSTQLIAAKGSVGLYSNLLIDDSGIADILYYNKGADSILRARAGSSGWSVTPVTAEGGRCLSRAVNPAGEQTLAYLNTSMNLAFL